MGFVRIIGYFCSIFMILAGIPLLVLYGLGLVLIVPGVWIIVVLRRQAKREVRMEDYERRQADSLERMTNPLGLTEEEQQALNEQKEKERKQLEKEEKKRGMPKINYTVVEDNADIDTDTDKKPRPRSITENLDIDNVTGNKEFEQDRIFCRFCGKSISTLGDYCPMCGKNLGSHPNQSKKCENCNIIFSEDSEYCAKCGTKL